MPSSRKRKAKKDYSLFPKGFWKRPEIDPKRQGDALFDPIFWAVGYALSAWEGVEEALAWLFLTLSQCKDADSMNAVRRAFGAIESNGGRLKAIEAAAEVYFGNYWEKEEITKPFEELVLQVKNGSWVRNEIAHGKAISAEAHSRSEVGEEIIRRTGCFLCSPEYATGRTHPFVKSIDDPLGSTKSNYRFIASDIMLFGSKFDLLKMKIFEYQGSILKEESKFPKCVVEMLIADAEGASSLGR